MHDHWQIRNFLIRNPHPAVIRLTSDGIVQEMKPGRKSRAKIAESIAATEPDLIECLDADGVLLRAMKPDPDIARSAKAPEVVEGLKGDPQAALMSHFANLIHRAYEHSTDIAFTKFVELVQILESRMEATDSRMERLEANLRREQQDRIDDLWDRAEEKAANGDDTMKNQIVSQLFSGVMQGQHEQAAAAARKAAAAGAKAKSNGNGRAR